MRLGLNIDVTLTNKYLTLDVSFEALTKGIFVVGYLFLKNSIWKIACLRPAIFSGTPRNIKAEYLA